MASGRPAARRLGGEARHVELRGVHGIDESKGTKTVNPVPNAYGVYPGDFSGVTAA